MDFELTEEQRLLKTTARRLARAEFQERACQWEGEYPLPNVKRLAELGLFGVSLPEAYGGGGKTLVEEMLVMEEVGRVCPDTVFALAGAPSMARMIAAFGSEEQKRKYLPPVTQQGSFLGNALSEPEAGSALNELKTRAEDRDGQIVLNGHKIFVSHADVAEALVVFVRFREGIGAMVVDKGTPGMTLGKPYVNMAGARQYPIYFDDCVIPSGQVLRRGRDAFRDLMSAFNLERCGSAMWALSTALCAFDKAVEYARVRKQFGKTLAEFQGIQWKLADMAMAIESARWLIYRAAALAAAGFPSRLETAMAKTVACEVGERVVSEALQIHGGYGYMKGHPLEYLYRLVRGRKIGGGTVEIQRNIIAAELIKQGGLP